MAEKRMFTPKITDSDAFLDMPLSAQALYFHLNMHADDDGFVNNPRRIAKLINASEDDLKILLLKRFIIGFDSGVIVIKHWRMHNTLRSDRYRPTDYQEEFSRLFIKPNKSYTDHQDQVIPAANQNSAAKMETSWQPVGNRLETQSREDVGLDKIREEENSTKDIGEEQIQKFPSLILNDGSEFLIPEDYYKKLLPLFPDVDLLKEFRKMSAWCLSNASKRKTRRGITRFINSWLSTEQERAENQKAKSSNIFLDMAEGRI